MCHVIGRIDGFRKILKLMVEADSDLTQEIARTIKHLLEVQVDELNIPSTTASPAPGASSSETPNLNVTSRLGGVVSNVGRLFIAELHRLFPNLVGKEGAYFA